MLFTVVEGDREPARSCSCCSTASEVDRRRPGRPRGARRRTSAATACSSTRALKVFAEVFGPPPRLVVVGAVDTGEALCAAARALGWRTICVDARAQFATPERMPSADEIIVEWPEEAFAQIAPDRDTAVVVLTHDDKFDIPALAAALRYRRVLRRRARQPPRAGEAPRAAARGRRDRGSSSSGSAGRPASTSAPRAPPRRRSRSSPRALALRAGRLGGPLREARRAASTSSAERHLDARRARLLRSLAGRSTGSATSRKGAGVPVIGAVREGASSSSTRTPRSSRSRRDSRSPKGRSGWPTARCTSATCRATSAAAGIPTRASRCCATRATSATG